MTFPGLEMTLLKLQIMRAVGMEMGLGGGVKKTNKKYDFS